MGKLLKVNEAIEIDDILEGDLIVYEDVQGSKIFVKFNGSNNGENHFIFKAKSLQSEPLNMIDLALQKYYGNAFEFFKKLPKVVTDFLDKNWWFCFEYFPDTQPANIKYDFLPLNGLVLTGICKGNEFKYEIEELIEFARLLKCDHVPVIFKGHLSDIQKKAIKYFIGCSPKDLQFIFDEVNFAKFFYKILSPDSETSFCMNTFQDNLEKVMIKVGNISDTFQILNPMYNKIAVENSTDFEDVYSVILMDFLSYCQAVDLDDEIILKENTKDQLYVSMMCQLFNMYIEDSGEDLLEMDIVIPEFFNKDKFKINFNYINNPLTKSYCMDEPKYEYILKIIIGSFNKKKKKPVGVLQESNIIHLNKYIDKLNEFLDKNLMKSSEQELINKGLINFGSFFDLKYPVDGDGKVYPDMYDEVEKQVVKSKKDSFYKKTLK